MVREESDGLVKSVRGLFAARLIARLTVIPRLQLLDFKVPGAGIEPTRSFWDLRILSPMRLPVPPPRLRAIVRAIILQMPGSALDLAALQRRRDRSLGLDPPPMLRTGADAARFLRRVGVALRYGAGSGLPLASMYHAAAGPDRDEAALIHAIEVTNHVIDSADGIEVNVIAERVCLVDRTLAPHLYGLVRRGRPVDDLSGLTLHARAAYQLLRERKEVTRGQVRDHLGIPATPNHDPGFIALDELQREMLVDRGPFEVKRKGVPYLSKEGYPFHFFHVVHADLAKPASRSINAAATAFLGAYLSAAVFCKVAKMTTMFRRFLRAEEIDRALGTLTEAGSIEIAGRGAARIAVWPGRA